MCIAQCLAHSKHLISLATISMIIIIVIQDMVSCWASTGEVVTGSLCYAQRNQVCFKKPIFNTLGIAWAPTKH